MYEDSGGLPNSLTFPRIEDIEAELERTTVQDLRHAMTVQIVCSSIEALPDFSVPAMRKTFGLCGVVQEIDKVCLLAILILNSASKMIVKDMILRRLHDALLLHNANLSRNVDLRLCY